MPAVIQIKHISKHFGSVTALRGVSLEVPQGSIYGFLGPNGAGKTTTIRCLMDFIRPDSGVIKILGKDAHSNGVELKQSIGYLPASGSLYGNWSGQEHIDFAAKLRRVDPNPSLAKQLDLNLKTKVSLLSTGNRQKLMIVLALLGNPALLLLDEPTKGLDPILQAQFYQILADFKARGGTVFMSSHILPEAEKICDGVTVIKSGKIIAEETMESLRRKSIHRVSAIFKGSVNPKIFQLTSTEIVHSTKDSVELKVKGDINSVVQLVSRCNLLDLEVAHASLEELFLEMYQ